MEVYKRRLGETFAVNIGMTPSEAAVQQSMGRLLEETDAAGIVHGVCHGRARDGSNNEDLVALLRQDPGRFIGFADIPLTDMGQAIEGPDVAGTTWACRTSC